MLTRKCEIDTVLLPMNTNNNNEIILWEKRTFFDLEELVRFTFYYSKYFYYELFSFFQCGSMHLIKSNTALLPIVLVNAKEFYHDKLSKATVPRRCSYKRMFWKHAANLQHNTNCSYKKVFWKHAATLQQNINAEARLLKSYLGMGVLL